MRVWSCCVACEHVLNPRLVLEKQAEENILHVIPDKAPIRPVSIMWAEQVCGPRGSEEPAMEAERKRPKEERD